MIEQSTWKEIVDKADLYKQLGQTKHYLYRQPLSSYPWQFVTDCEGGSSHRLEISTDVRFTALHPSGLEFSWSVEIESAEANGHGYYCILVDTIISVFALLNDPAKRKFKKYLAGCALAVRAQSDKLFNHWQSQVAAAVAMEKLSEQ